MGAGHGQGAIVMDRATSSTCSLNGSHLVLDAASNVGLTLSTGGFLNRFHSAGVSDAVVPIASGVLTVRDEPGDQVRTALSRLAPTGGSPAETWVAMQPVSASEFGMVEHGGAVWVFGNGPAGQVEIRRFATTDGATLPAPAPIVDAHPNDLRRLIVSGDRVYFVGNSTASSPAFVVEYRLRDGRVRRYHRALTGSVERIAATSSHLYLRSSSGVYRVPITP